MRKSAEVIIVGGGISGCSIAYNLAKKGVKDIVVLGKAVHMRRFHRSVRRRGAHAVGHRDELPLFKVQHRIVSKGE